MRNDRVHTNAIIVKREQSTDVTKSNSTSNTMHSPNDLIIDGDKAPYYCPDCGIGLGYSFSSYKHHIGIQKGLCRNNAGRPLYGCKICKQEFLQISSLKRHYESYGNSCKAKQISINRERYNLCKFIIFSREFQGHDFITRVTRVLTNSMTRESSSHSDDS